MLCIGGFSNYNAAGTQIIVRLAAIGTINTAFNTAIGTKFVAFSSTAVAIEGASGRIYIGKIGAVYNAAVVFDICVLNNDGSFNSVILLGTTIGSGISKLSRNKSKIDILGSYTVTGSGLNSFYQVADLGRQAYKTRFQVFKTALNTYTTSTPETLSDSLVGLVVAVNSSGQLTYTTTDLGSDTNTISMRVNEYGF